MGWIWLRLEDIDPTFAAEIEGGRPGEGDIIRYRSRSEGAGSPWGRCVIVTVPVGQSSRANPFLGYLRGETKGSKLQSRRELAKHTRDAATGRYPGDEGPLPGATQDDIYKAAMSLAPYEWREVIYDHDPTTNGAYALSLAILGHRGHLMMRKDEQGRRLAQLTASGAAWVKRVSDEVRRQRAKATAPDLDNGTGGTGDALLFPPPIPEQSRVSEVEGEEESGR